MEIGHLKQQLYPRAVSASVEGSLQQEYPRSGQTQAQASQGRERPVPQHVAQRGSHEPAAAPPRLYPPAAAHSPAAELEADHATAMLAASLGEKLAQSRQVRHSASKRGYTPAAMVSATGKRAHASYQQPQQGMPARFVDEVV